MCGVGGVVVYYVGVYFVGGQYFDGVVQVFVFVYVVVFGGEIYYVGVYVVGGEFKGCVGVGVVFEKGGVDG